MPRPKVTLVSSNNQGACLPSAWANLERSAQGPKRSPQDKWPQQEEVTLEGPPGALNRHPGA
jgi:hypothetical protein